MTGASRALPSDLAFRPASSRDADLISELARDIWTDVYTEMIGLAQIEYMLEWMYPPGTLRREMAQEDIAYVLIEYRGASVGYLGFGRKDTETQLHKLYLRADLHGRGFGSAALRWLADHCRATGVDSIRLRVNKNNTAAIRAYERNGFERVGSICEDIGGGFVMDDFIYLRSL